jgi:16S rRNA processing protein RimM
MSMPAGEIMKSEETAHNPPLTGSDTEALESFTVLAAQICGAHGVTGNVRVRLVGARTDLTAASLQASRILKASGDGNAEPRCLTLTSLRRLGEVKSGWIAHFKEVNKRDDAKALTGLSLYIQETKRAGLPQGEYYVDQLIGLSVVTDTGHGIGVLQDVLSTPANDVYLMDTGVMVPAVSEFIADIDLERRQIVVRDVPGLREGT